jgi:hypothetical protein
MWKCCYLTTISFCWTGFYCYFTTVLTWIRWFWFQTRNIIKSGKWIISNVRRHVDTGNGNCHDWSESVHVFLWFYIYKEESNLMSAAITTEKAFFAVANGLKYVARDNPIQLKKRSYWFECEFIRTAMVNKGCLLCQHVTKIFAIAWNSFNIHKCCL